MKISLVFALRFATVIATLATLPLAARATETNAATRAAHALATQGRLAIAQVGNDVAPGSFQIHVQAKLGQPSARRGEGTWFYRNYEVADGAAKGTLVVTFTQGRVTALTLVTPAIATAMLAQPPSDHDTRVASTK